MLINKRYRFIIIILVIVLFLFAGVGISNIKNAIAQYNMTGIWRGNDGANYYVRQVGSDIFGLV
jgi:hypothetical protein